ncbi:hypothetical protein [Xenorhabdus griffiniae]|uniref:Uncharacterized protein n=1 Tax=Xenorhabdus griffiniae TaxID=351672 RepID=A0ABY9XL15_9GAMM|nr:hypothetical protein [Xenorhabdus griffiniae]MBD1229243.1 hypothetical protein [Xenorhabdus griffiniae]MBE8589000.1 hypothetical protein [Xenorhabdus griffiniae]WMV73501.1 hypothetical protein QL128_05620 [Xenorhabdus griffiniae]WNH03181.1 hypothetical protein QL112_005625 [Xenorhabdus griffiniae]
MNKPDNVFPIRGDLPSKIGGGDGGDEMLEARVARLESDVEHIKTTMNDMKSDLKSVTSDIGVVKTDVALILQKMDNLSSSVESKANNSDVALILQKMDSLSSSVNKKASFEQVDTKIGGLKIWFLTLLLFSIGMPVIMFLLNLYMKKP